MFSMRRGAPQPKGVPQERMGRGNRRRAGFAGVAEPLEPRWMLDGDPVPNFALRDVNPNSDTFNQFVSPRNYQGEISAWYFGHAT